MKFVGSIVSALAVAAVAAPVLAQDVSGQQYRQALERERAQAAAGLAARQAARNGNGPLLPGTYNCIAGFSVMLTLGKITISGLSYRFQPPSGPATAGTYSVSPAGIRWNGNLGVIRSSDIATSGKEIANPEVFWFKYRAPGHTSTTTTSCHRLR